MSEPRHALRASDYHIPKDVIEKGREVMERAAKQRAIEERASLSEYAGYAEPLRPVPAVERLNNEASRLEELAGELFARFNAVAERLIGPEPPSTGEAEKIPTPPGQLGDLSALLQRLDAWFNGMRRIVRRFEEQV